MIEFYQAYADYKDLMALTENMLEKLTIDILGSTDVPYGDEVYISTKVHSRKYQCLMPFLSIIQTSRTKM